MLVTLALGTNLALQEVFTLQQQTAESVWTTLDKLATTSLSAIKSQWHSVGSSRTSSFTRGWSFYNHSQVSLSSHTQTLTVCVQSPCPGPVSLNVSSVSGYLGFPPGRKEQRVFTSVGCLLVWKGTRQRQRQRQHCQRFCTCGSKTQHCATSVSGCHEDQFTGQSEWVLHTAHRALDSKMFRKLQTDWSNSSGVIICTHAMLFPYLCEVVQRLDDVSLDGELEEDELLSESLLRLSAELQHFPAARNVRKQS